MIIRRVFFVEKSVKEPDNQENHTDSAAILPFQRTRAKSLRSAKLNRGPSAFNHLETAQLKSAFTGCVVAFPKEPPRYQGHDDLLSDSLHARIRMGLVRSWVSRESLRLVYSEGRACQELPPAFLFDYGRRDLSLERTERALKGILSGTEDWQDE
ncbi:hypothetical protein [Pseudohaliea sp.]|uniref:hypothetical protein n=1 Tax=Pseudohaliea sp. TaxID=2740289 RepID=UPI0032EE8243